MGCCCCCNSRNLHNPNDHKQRIAIGMSRLKVPCLGKFLNSWLVGAILFILFPNGEGHEDGQQQRRQLIQSHEIWGYGAPVTSAVDMNRVLSCFMGVGLTKCSEVASTEPDAFLDFGYSPYTWTDVPDGSGGKLYCYECCQNNINYLRVGPPEHVVACGTASGTDTFNGQFLDTNLKDYEFRFARRKFEADTEVVSCPLIRDDSAFSSSFEPELVGYTLELVVKEYNTGLNYWRGVESCTATGIMVKSLAERQSNLFVFTEKVRVYNASGVKAILNSFTAAILAVVVLCSLNL